MSQSANRGGMTSATNSYPNRYGQIAGVMNAGNYGSNFQNGMWNGPGLNYSNGLLNPQGTIAGLSGWSSNTMNTPQSTVDPSWYTTPYAQNPTATPGQTAFPGVDMNSGQLFGSTTPASQPVVQQQPTTSTPSTGMSSNGVRVNPVTGQLEFM